MTAANLRTSISPAIGRSLWREVSAPPGRAEPLTGKIDAETIVIGAGVAGLSTALHLARLGRSVLVIEAADAPDGATAASAGIIAPQLVRKSPNDVLRLLGSEKGTRLLQAIAESGRYTFDLIREEGLDCAASNSGFLAPFFASQRGAADLVKQWARYRRDIELLDGPTTERVSGCRGYAGAILDRTGGMLNPVAYANALAHRAAAYGARIHRKSPVEHLQRHGRDWLIRTPGGEASARTVVICANGGAGRLHPRLANTVLPLPVCEVATQPLQPDLRSTILPEGHALTDISTDVFSIRKDSAGRLITACPAPDRLDYDQLNSSINRRLSAMLPAWRPTPLEFAWTGTAWLNSDLLPRLVMVEPGLVAVQSCNGRGLAISGLAGREMARWIASNGAELPLLGFARAKPVAGFSLARHIPRLLHSGAQLRRVLFGRS